MSTRVASPLRPRPAPVSGAWGGLRRGRLAGLVPLGALVALIASGSLPCHRDVGAGPGVANAASAAGAGDGGAASAHLTHFTAAPRAPLVEGAAADAPAPAVLEIPISLSEWKLTPARLSVPVGQAVRFLVTNTGALPHALTVEGDGLFIESEAVGSGQTAPLDMIFNVAGVYDLYCPVGAGQHRALGQEGLAIAGPEANDERGPGDDTALAIVSLGPEAHESQGDMAAEQADAQPTPLAPVDGGEVESPTLPSDAAA